MSFRYVREARGPNTTWTDEPGACGVCGETRAGYEGPFSGGDDVELVCEPCLVAGRSAERGLSTNEGDTAALRRQLAERGDPQTLVEERRAELEERTPYLVTWQAWHWPAHCGDFCRFERQVGRRELTELAADGDGERVYRAAVAEEPLDWEHLPPDGDAVYDVGVYLFRCLVCEAPVIRWDAS